MVRVIIRSFAHSVHGAIARFLLKTSTQARFPGVRNLRMTRGNMLRMTRVDMLRMTRGDMLRMTRGDMLRMTRGNMLGKTRVIPFG